MKRGCLLWSAPVSPAFRPNGDGVSRGVDLADHPPDQGGEGPGRVPRERHRPPPARSDRQGDRRQNRRHALFRRPLGPEGPGRDLSRHVPPQRGDLERGAVVLRRTRLSKRSCCNVSVATGERPRLASRADSSILKAKHNGRSDGGRALPRRMSPYAPFCDLGMRGPKRTRCAQLELAAFDQSRHAKQSVRFELIF